MEQETKIEAIELIELENPLKVVDIETTGVDVQKGGDKTIQMCIKNIKKDKTEQTKVTKLFPSPFSEIKKEKEGTLVELPDGRLAKRIHPKAQEVHNISMEDLLESPDMKSISESLMKFLSSGYIIFYSGLFFDRTILENELKEFNPKFKFSDKLIDPYLIYLHFNPNIPKSIEDLYDLEIYPFENYTDDVEGKNTCILNYYILKYNLNHRDMIGKETVEATIMSLYRRENNNKLTTLYQRLFGEELTDAHDAEKDVDATLKVYLKLKEMYGFTDDEAVEITTNPAYARVERFPSVSVRDGVAYFAIGKYKDTKLVDLPIDYVNWMEKNNFDIYLIKYIYWLKEQELNKTKEVNITE